MRYQIYEAKSVKHDAQQRVGISNFHLFASARKAAPLTFEKSAEPLLRFFQFFGGYLRMNQILAAGISISAANFFYVSQCFS